MRSSMFDDSVFYKPGNEYCAECVGRRDFHTDDCSVPAQALKGMQEWAQQQAIDAAQQKIEAEKPDDAA